MPVFILPGQAPVRSVWRWATAARRPGTSAATSAGHRAGRCRRLCAADWQTREFAAGARVEPLGKHFRAGDDAGSPRDRHGWAWRNPPTASANWCARRRWTNSGRIPTSRMHGQHEVAADRSVDGDDLRRPGLGHGDRSDEVHRLQRLRGGLPGGEQHADRGQGAGRAGREMHWMRIDRYFRGDIENPQVVHAAGGLPALRERAVRAGLPGGGDGAQRRGPERHGLQPLHRHALLREQLPLQGAPVQLLQLSPRIWTDPNRQLVQMAINPEVTVRSRGVMEKCTYCVQRIQSGQDRRARTSDAADRDGEIETACQQACPTQAIEFGDLNKQRKPRRAGSCQIRGPTGCWPN